MTPDRGQIGNGEPTEPADARGVPAAANRPPDPRHGSDGAALREQLARLWWIGAARGVIALLLGLSMVFASTSQNRIATYLAIYWLSGGLLTLRFAWAIRPRKGFHLASVAGWVAVVAAALVLLREALSGLFEPTTVVDVLGYASVAMGTLRLMGAFALEQRTGRRWSLGGLVLGALEVGTGILLVLVDVSSPAVVKTVAAWAFATGTILLIEALRLRAAGRA